MKEDKSFIDLLAKPGIALKLKALSIPSAHTTYERGQNYSLLPAGTEYLFAPKKEAEESETNSGLFGKLSYSLNKIAEKLSSNLSPYSYVYKNEKNAYGSIDNSKTEKILFTKIASPSFTKTYNSNLSAEKKLFVANAKNNSLAELSNKVNELLRHQGDTDYFDRYSYLNKNHLSNTSTSIINKLTSTTTKISGNTNINKESFVNLKGYLAGLNSFNNRTEPMVKTNFVAGNSERAFSKPKNNQYYITQNFGDIIVQPASMDMSIQQVKYKIEDVLRQVKDSLY